MHFRKRLRAPGTQPAPPPTIPPEPEHSAEAWCAFLARQAEATRPAWLPPAHGLRAARDAAWRTGQFTETKPTQGGQQ